jgi:hypothetical protein
MSKSAAATRHVVERCPCCGVEHDVSVGSICEACETPLRAWCRTHSREAGWLDGSSCPHCAREAARRRPGSAPRPTPTSAPRRPAAAPARPPLPVPAAPTPLLSRFAGEATPGSGERDTFHATGASPADSWGEALTQVAVKTAFGAVAGAVGGCVSALALGSDVASIADAAGAAAAMLGFAGFAIGTALGCAIVLDDG